MFTPKWSAIGNFSFLLLLMISNCDACGVSTHVDIAHVAATFFKSSQLLSVDYRKLIFKHQDAFVAGNSYPDSYYASICFGGYYHQVSEDTHWGEFLNVSINYVRRVYPEKWDQV